MIARQLVAKLGIPERLAIIGAKTFRDAIETAGVYTQSQNRQILMRVVLEVQEWYGKHVA